MYLPRRIMQRICIFTSILVFFLIDMLYRECIFNVFFVFLYFFTRDNIAKKNAYVCCFQSKRKPKNSYVYSCRDKETRMCIVLCKPRKQMYQCILPQTPKTIEKGTRFSATFAVSSRSFGCAVERLAAVIFSLLFFTPGGLCGGKFICACNVCHECIQLATLTVAVLAKRKKEVKLLQFDNPTKKTKNNVFPRNGKMQN